MSLQQGVPSKGSAPTVHGLPQLHRWVMGLSPAHRFVTAHEPGPANRTSDAKKDWRQHERRWPRSSTAHRSSSISRWSTITRRSRREAMTLADETAPWTDTRAVSGYLCELAGTAVRTTKQRGASESHETSWRELGRTLWIGRERQLEREKHPPL